MRALDRTMNFNNGTDDVPVSPTNPMPVKGVGSGITASANFTPAAAPYSAGDLISTVQEFVFTYADGTPIPSGSLIRLLSSVVKIDETAILSGETSYRSQLYSVTPPAVAFADNDTWTLKSTHLSAYRGPIELGTPIDLGECAYVKSQIVDLVTGQAGIDVKLSGTSLFGGLVTVGGATFTAVARQVLLNGIIL